MGTSSDYSWLGPRIQWELQNPADWSLWWGCVGISAGVRGYNSGEWLSLWSYWSVVRFRKVRGRRGVWGGGDFGACDLPSTFWFKIVKNNNGNVTDLKWVEDRTNLVQRTKRFHRYKHVNPIKFTYLKSECMYNSNCNTVERVSEIYKMGN